MLDVIFHRRLGSRLAIASSCQYIVSLSSRLHPLAIYFYFWPLRVCPCLRSHLPCLLVFWSLRLLVTLTPSSPLLPVPSLRPFVALVPSSLSPSPLIFRVSLLSPSFTWPRVLVPCSFSSGSRHYCFLYHHCHLHHLGHLPRFLFFINITTCLLRMRR